MADRSTAGVVIHLLGERVQHLSRAVEALQRQEITTTDPDASTAAGGLSSATQRQTKAHRER